MKYLYQLNKILTVSQKKTAIFLVFLTFISMLLEILTLNFMLILLRSMTNPSILSNSKFFIYLKNLNFNYDLSLIIILVFVGSFFLKTIFNVFISFKEQKFIYTTRADLSYIFFKGYVYLPKIFHLRSNTSDLIKNITEEITRIMISLDSLSKIIMETVVLFGIFIFLLFINFKLTILCFLLLIIFSVLVNLINSKKIIKMGKDRTKVVQLRLKSIIEGLAGSKVFELTGSQKNLLSDFSKHNIKFSEIDKNVGFRGALPKPLFELFLILLIGAIIIFTFQDKSQIVNVIPILGVFLTAAYRSIPSFSRIVANIQRFQFSIQSAEKLSRDMEKFKNIQFKLKDEASKMIFKNSIDFQDVSFSYNKNLKLESNFVLKKVNIKINKGSKIGIVGESGSGKSTFLDLIIGLISPQYGEILIDEKKIIDIKPNWQKIIGCVPQEVFILDDTLKKNVAFGIPDMSINNDKVTKAIELANLDEFKNSLKFGLETLLGEGGSRISGGQRQRIGIARALYSEPDILILDEATNALDEQTEKKIIKEIFQAKYEKTIIFVSHNIKNLSFCDSIFETRNKALFKLN